ncbi:MAG: hypothetical protein Q7J29_01795 [Stagnimonas sp.]|nr:hypothetical protein [Stagnimonas sp.]
MRFWKAIAVVAWAAALDKTIKYDFHHINEMANAQAVHPRISTSSRMFASGWFEPVKTDDSRSTKTLEGWQPMEDSAP